MRSRAINIIVLLFFGFLSFAQSIEVEHTIKVSFDNVPLEQVLETMSKMYNYKFSYIPEKMPLQQPVQWHAGDATNTQNIEDFLVEQHIQFKKIGDQYVLRYRENSGNIVDFDPDGNLVNYQGEDNSGFTEMEEFTPRPIFDTSQIEYKNQDEHLLPEYVFDPEIQLSKDDRIRVSNEPQTPLEMLNQESAQVSLFGSFGTNKGNIEKVNKASINILYGHNAGVEGFEIGAGINKIDEDVKGVQIAGLGNFVGGKVSGFQSSAAYNQTQNLDGVQLSGGINIVNDTLQGLQIASLANIHRGAVGGFQFASFVNTSHGKSTGQIAGLYNQAKSIDGIQLAPINKAEDVEGLQIGLINIADTVSGASIGLLNFVKKGYKHLEVYHTESMFANLSYTFGSQRFYNRLIVSASSYQKNFIWGFGFGIGSNLYLSEKNSINLDMQWQQLNVDGWSDYVNFLNTFSVNLTTRMSKNVNFFMGPSFNLYIKSYSNVSDVESLTARPDILPYYTKYETKQIGNNHYVKGWVGWKVGFRFF